MNNRLMCVAVVAASGLFVAVGLAGATPPARSMLLTSAIEQPIVIASTPADPQRLYIGARAGSIFTVDRTTGEVSPDKVIDLSSLVDIGGDNGLLGMAFDPAFAVNGHLYAIYIAPDGSAVLERYTIHPGTRTADLTSARVILRYQRPQLGHQGGWIGFSPTNGQLYISSGDGDPGGSFDIANHAQTIVNDRMGKMLRIDPHSDDFPADPNRNYHIPAGNPFIASAGDDEIWAYGLRNPWRCSFDRLTGDLYIADVGMNAWEELNFEPSASPGGRNYGWPCTEGTHCTTSDNCMCGSPALTAPIHEYPHSVGLSIIGGYVYRGAAIPAYQGRYFFGDWLRAKIWSCVPGAAGITDLRDHSAEFIPPTTDTPIGWISCFGEDAAGELYAADIVGSRVYRIVPYPCLPVVDGVTDSRTLPEDSTIALRVYGAGADPLTYRWRKDDRFLGDDARIRGATTAQLDISNAVQSDSGVYVCVLTSPCGSTESPPVTILVRDCYHTDFNRDDEVSVQDIFDYLNAWLAGDPTTDLNGDGQDTQDILDFINSWLQGCL